MAIDLVNSSKLGPVYFYTSVKSPSAMDRVVELIIFSKL